MAATKRMKLLIDTDAFCKLGMAGLLDPAIEALGAAGGCGRLPALPHMLRRGRLPRTYGADVCERLLREAEKLPSHHDPDAHWLDELTGRREIDPGEVALFAAGATTGSLVLTGDRRAVRALAAVDSLHTALAERVVMLEAMLIRLCDDLGVDEVRRCLEVVRRHDRIISICFSAENPDSRLALHSYHQDFAEEVHPLKLWEPVEDTQG
jgi:hypothetical protein